MEYITLLERYYEAVERACKTYESLYEDLRKLYLIYSILEYPYQKFIEYKSYIREWIISRKIRRVTRSNC